MKLCAQWDVNKSELFGIDADWVKRSGGIVPTPSGGLRTTPAIANERRKWEIDYSVKVIPGETNIDSVSEFLQTLKDNRQCAFSQEFSRYPARVFPAGATRREVPTSQRGNAKPLGELVNFRIQER